MYIRFRGRDLNMTFKRSCGSNLRVERHGGGSDGEGGTRSIPAARINHVKNEPIKICS